MCVCVSAALLQHRADASIRNTDGKTALDVAEPLAAQVLSGEYKRSELLQAARSATLSPPLSLSTSLCLGCRSQSLSLLHLP